MKPVTVIFSLSEKKKFAMYVMGQSLGHRGTVSGIWNKLLLEHCCGVIQQVDEYHSVICLLPLFPWDGAENQEKKSRTRGLR